jgi:hypothetical protein
MAVRKYRRTLVVTQPIIELWPGIFLPKGRYDVVDEQIMAHMCGRAGEIPGRVILRLSRETLIAYGIDAVELSAMGIEKDIRAWIEAPGISMK